MSKNPYLILKEEIVELMNTIDLCNKKIIDKDIILDKHKRLNCNNLDALEKLEKELEFVNKKNTELELNRGCLTNDLKKSDKEIRKLEVTLDLRCDLKDIQLENYRIDISTLKAEKEYLVQNAKILNDALNDNHEIINKHCLTIENQKQDIEEYRYMIGRNYFKDLNTMIKNLFRRNKVSL